MSLHIFLPDQVEKKAWLASKKDVCVLTAGVARTPSMSCDDLLGVNCKIRREVPEKTS